MNTGLIWLEHVHWGLTTAVYLFAAALGGGAYLAALAAVGIPAMGHRESRRTFARWASLVALGSVAIAGVAILSHLGAPLRALLFPLSLTNAGSWITRGTWILVSLGVVTALQTLWLHFRSTEDGPTGGLRRVARRIGIAGPIDRLAAWSRPSDGQYWAILLLGALPAIGTVYTGFELAAVSVVPLWSTPLVPALFLATGIAAGIATPLVLTVGSVGVADRTVAVFGSAVGLALFLTAGLAWGYWRAIGETAAATESIAALTDGAYALAVDVAVIALLVALVATPVFSLLAYRIGRSRLSQRILAPGLIASLSLVVVSSFLLRYVLVLAAVKEPIVAAGV